METCVVPLLMHPEGKITDDVLMFLKDPNEEDSDKNSLFELPTHGDLPEFSAHSHTI